MRARAVFCSLCAAGFAVSLAVHVGALADWFRSGTALMVVLHSGALVAAILALPFGGPDQQASYGRRLWRVFSEANNPGKERFSWAETMRHRPRWMRWLAWACAGYALLLFALLLGRFVAEAFLPGRLGWHDMRWLFVGYCAAIFGWISAMSYPERDRQGVTGGNTP
jgi:hypothetical protein